MVLRKFVTAVLIIMMTSPAWGADPVGNITSSNAATVRDTALAPGSTLFSGDAISVGERGIADISLTTGAQAEVLGSSLVRMTKSSGTIQMTVDRGQASFHASGNSGIEAHVADATVRPASPNDTIAVIQALSETHAVVAAQKGALLVTSASTGMTYALHEGEAADLTAAAADPQTKGTPLPAGKSVPRISSPNKPVVIWTAVIVSAGVAVTAYLLLRREPSHSLSTLGNEISPTKLN